MTGQPRGRWAVTGARAVTGAIVAAAAVVAVTVAVAAPWPSIARAPLSVVVAPTPSDTLAVCDGALLAAGRVAADAERITVAAAQTPIAGSDGEVQELVLDSPDVQRAEGVPAFAAAPRGRVTTPLAAAASARIADEDLAGFSADACRPPLFDSWLVGGSTTTGSSDLVLLANPGEVTATVEITAYGASGASVPPGGSGLSVPARTQLVIPLAGLALGEDSPVLRVTATGAPVRASLQSSLVRTLVPGGVDQQSAVATAAKTAVIPSVVVTTPSADTGTGDTPTILRVLSAAASGEAVVTVTAVGASKPAIPPGTIPLSEAVPTELDLAGLPAGAYVVTVEATVPVVAAVWQATGFGTGSDFAWLTAAPPLPGATLLAVPAGLPGRAPTLQLVNRGEADATVTLEPIEGTGSHRDVTVPAGGSASVALTSRSVWRIDPGGTPGLYGQVTMSGPGALAGFAVWPSDAAATPVRVYP